MENKLRNHIEGLFANAPKTVQAVEIKEEIIANTIQKYHDLISEGKTEEAAFNISIASIGDVSELIASLKNPVTSSGYTTEQIDKSKKRSALLISIAVMLYILCVLPVIIFGTYSNNEALGVILMFVMIAVATGIIIYNANTKIKYTKTDETIVEDFKEWNNQNSEKKNMIKAINGAIFAITLAIYFIISFATGAWYITWVIFLISGAIENIVKAIFDLKK